MIIDVFYLICLVLFLYRGYKKGVIVALFAVVSIIIGIFCALKFSNLMAGWLFKDASKSSAWVPVLSYIVVFALTVWLVRWGAKAMDKMLNAVFLGWMNRLSGALLYGFLLTLIFSTFLWLINGVGMIEINTQNESHCYHFLIAFAPRIFSLIGNLLPFMKNAFHDLAAFFDILKTKA
jgi:membrane protein required for colicin V production